MIRHIQLKVSTALRMASGSREEQNRIKRVLGFEKVADLREQLAKMQAKGFAVIPTEGCEHDGTGVCPGHKSEEQN
jgi:hypothetical protein